MIRNRSADRRGALEGGLVASVTIARVKRVVVAHMAGRARRRRRRHMRSGQRKSRYAVIKCRRRPARRRMASRTVRRGKGGAGSRVHRSIRLLPGGQVALGVSAIGRRDIQGVVVIDVAQIAGHIRMPIRQQKSCRAVVKRCRRPTNGTVAQRAIRRRKSRPGGWMHRIRGCLPGGQMALRIPAISRRDRQIVVVVDMAERASHIRMAVGQ